MMRLTLLALALAAFLPHAALAQGDSAPPPPAKLVIAQVDYIIEGETKEFVLAEKAGLPIGKEFSSVQELEAFLAERRQALLNERVLESVEVEYSRLPGPDEIAKVRILVRVRDSWNIIALPYFRFDSNTGLVLSARGRHYNFMGSMQTLVLNLDFARSAEGRNSYGGYTNFEIPFQAGDVRLGVGISSDVRIYGDGAPPTSSSSLGLNAAYSGWGFPVWASLSQGLATNPDGVIGDSDPYFMKSTAAAGFSLSLLENFGGLGALSWAPSASLARYWRFDAPVRQDRQGDILTLSHSLSAGRVDWIENMKSGAALSVSNTAYYYAGSAAWIFDVDAEARLYATVGGAASAKGRISYFNRLVGDLRYDVGGALRGILDARIDAHSGVFANFDFPVKLFDFPTHVFIGKNWFDFELQASPFLDCGLVSSERGAAPSTDDLWLSGGLELYVYPLRMRSFIVRGSLGFDLVNAYRTGSLTAAAPDGRSPYEIFFGLGLAF